MYPHWIKSKIITHAFTNENFIYEIYNLSYNNEMDIYKWDFKKKFK